MGTKREITFERGAQGRCTSKKYSSGIKLTVTAGDDEGTIYEISKDNINIPTISAENMFFKLNSDNTFLYNLHPYGDYEDMVENYPTVFDVHYIGMPRKKDAVAPMYWTKQGRPAPWNAKQWLPEQLMFTVLLEILGPKKFAGLQLSHALLYGFDRDDLGNMKIVGVGNDATKLDNFLTVAGFDWIDDELPYSSNVLPDLDELLLDRDRPFLAKIRRGYVNKVMHPREGISP